MIILKDIIKHKKINNFCDRNPENIAYCGGRLPCPNVFLRSSNLVISLSSQQPTSSYGVPPVKIADEDIRPRGTSGKRPPVFGYYPPSQRVMPRVNRKFYSH